MNLRSWFRKRRSPLRHNAFQFERLERRQMLTASAPTVVDVTVAGTAWNSGYLDYLDTHGLGTGGYSIPDGGSAQLLPLAWNNLNQIKIKFSENVKVEQSDLTLTGINVTQYQFSNFSYDSQTFVATWTLTASIGADRLLIDLAGDGLDPIVDLDDGYVLDGEWTNGSSSYASGNSTQGGDFEFRFDVLPGDVTQNGTITTLDYGKVYQKRNTSVTTGAYEPLYDVNGSGTIDAADYTYVQGVIGIPLPTGNPAGLSNDTPTAAFSEVNINEDAAEQNISLWDAFDDAEEDDDDLTYQVMSNTNSSLFSSLSVDAENGELVFNTADNAWGSADIVVRATDSGGLYTEALLQVNVAAVNDAPVISSFIAGTQILDIWILTGTVSDVDNNPEGWTVYFYGVLEGYHAEVEADGTFELIVQLDPYVYGETWVQVSDPHGGNSNTPVQWVGVT